MEVLVLGTGCANCRALYEQARLAVESAGGKARLRKVEDMQAIMGHGVMRLPALVVDGKVRCSGRVAAAAEITQWLGAAASGLDQGGRP